MFLISQFVASLGVVLFKIRFIACQSYYLACSENEELKGFVTNLYLVSHLYMVFFRAEDVNNWSAKKLAGFLSVQVCRTLFKLRQYLVLWYVR